MAPNLYNVELQAGNVQIFVTDRHGGVSEGRYASLNLADHVGDEPQLVHMNRKRVAERLSIDASDFCWMEQVHGAEVANATPGTTKNVDALVTTNQNQPIAILTADCAPVVLVGEKETGVVHAGWRGLQRGVIQKAVTAMHAPKDIIAFLGPTIRPDNYAFGPDELDRLEARWGPEVRSETRNSDPALDLPAAVRIALAETGIEKFEDCGIDTFTNPDFYSFRRDGITGRMATIAIRRG